MVEFKIPARFLHIYVLGDTTFKIDSLCVFLDLDSVHAVVELDHEIVALDDNLFGVDFVWLL